MKLGRFITLASIVFIGMLIARYFDQPSPRQIAYDVCFDCGMSVADVDGLVTKFTGATEPREKLLELYRSTFKNPVDVDCLDCANAILAAAGVAK